MCRLIAQTNRDPCAHEECKAANSFDSKCIRTLPIILHPPHAHEPNNAEQFKTDNQAPKKKLQVEAPQVNLYEQIQMNQQMLGFSGQTTFPSMPNLPMFQTQSPQMQNTTNMSFSKPAQNQDTINNNTSLNNNAFTLLINQNKLLMELKEKEERVEQTIMFLVNEIATLKAGFQSGQMAPPGQAASRSTEVATSDMLLKMLYPNADFLYNLTSAVEFPSLLYRERYFRLEVQLTDLRTGQRVTNPNKIRLALALYTSENPPKAIQVNTSGNKVFKGAHEIDLISGVAVFDKVQINEVSSHFLNGRLFLVVYPKFTPEAAQNMGFLASYSGGLFTDPTRIKPLILDKIVVKAKKLKND